jgi:hypothetical protein
MEGAVTSGSSASNVVSTIALSLQRSQRNLSTFHPLALIGVWFFTNAIG